MVEHQLAYHRHRAHPVYLGHLVVPEVLVGLEHLGFRFLHVLPYHPFHPVYLEDQELLVHLGNHEDPVLLDLPYRLDVLGDRLDPAVPVHR